MSNQPLDVLNKLKKSLGVETLDIQKREIDGLTYEFKALDFADKISATNMAYSYVLPLSTQMAEVVIGIMFVSYSIISIDGLSKPEVMGLELSDVDQLSWKTSRSFSEQLNIQSSILLSHWFLKGMKDEVIYGLIQEYKNLSNDALTFEDVAKYLDHVKKQLEEESKKTDNQKSEEALELSKKS